MLAVKVFVTFLLFVGFVVHAEETPFWMEPKHQARLAARDILVSVRNENDRTHMKGVGWVETTVDHAFRFAQDYGRLSQFPDHFADVRYEPESRILALTIKVALRNERVKVKIDPRAAVDSRFLDFEVLEGLGRGTRGVVEFQDLKRQDGRIQVSLRAQTRPGGSFSWLLNLGIEALLQHMAKSLRTLLETESRARPPAIRSDP